MKAKKNQYSEDLLPQTASPSISDVVLSPEEEAFLDPEFLREAVAGAIEAVQQRNVRISRLLGMRDLLFATWLRRTFNGSEHGSGDGVVESEIERLELEVATVVRDASGDIELPHAVQTVTRVTEFAVARDLNVAKYLRVVDASMDSANALDGQGMCEIEAMVGAHI
jgi:hypothetical protein